MADMRETYDENPIEIEIESLEAIYINELTYKRKEDGTLDSIELLLHPATGDDTAKQFVCMTLVFTPSPKYPDEIPNIAIKNPRGLGEEEVQSLVEDMISKAKECVGEVMLFTLIEMAKDSLTEGNIPHCACVVCLEHFQEDDLFHRTACYHYFHNRCLHRYLEHSRKQKEEKEMQGALERRHMDASEEENKTIGCPLCRAPLSEDSLSITLDPSELEKQQQEEGKEPLFVLPPDMREQLANMAEMFAQQKAKGGIIDLEEERNKFLVNPEDRLPSASIAPTETNSKEKPDTPACKLPHQLRPSQQHGHGNHSTRERHYDKGRRDDQRESSNSARGGGRNARGAQHQEGYGYGNDHQHSGQGRGRGRSNHGGFHRLSGRYENDKSPRYLASVWQAMSECDSLWQKGAKNPRSPEREVQKCCVKSTQREGVVPSQHTVGSYENFEDVKSTRHETACKSFSDESEGSHNYRRNEGGNERGRGGCSNRPRGRERRGGGFSGRRKDETSYHGRLGDEERRKGDNEKKVEEQNPSAKGENLRMDSSAADRVTSVDGDSFVKEQKSDGVRTYQRGRGRGRFRDMDEAYFTGKSKKSDSPVDGTERRVHRRDLPNSRGKGGCREIGRRDHYRGNEYDDDGDDNYHSNEYRRPAGSGRGERGGGRDNRRGGGRDNRRGGSSGQSSESKVQNGQQQMQGSHYGGNQIKFTGSVNGRVDACDFGEDTSTCVYQKAAEELEINCRWRKLNFGYVSGTKAGNASSFQGTDNDDDRSGDSATDIENCGALTNRYYTASCSEADLNQYYVGYKEVEEEENWDKERFEYAFERRHIRTEDLEEYDEFRKKDYSLMRKKMKEEADRERLLREEDRRMRREHAELERRVVNAVESKQSKSVLELFQEKQEAKKREAERLKREQEQQKEKCKKADAELMSDDGFHSSYFPSDAASSSSCSSQGYQSQISTEDLPPQNLPDHTNNKKTVADKVSDSVEMETETQRNFRGKKDTQGQGCEEIQWVGVKKKPDPGDGQLSFSREGAVDNSVRPGLDDPSIDAWERREDRKRAAKKKKRSKQQQSESNTNTAINLRESTEIQRPEVSMSSSSGLLENSHVATVDESLSSSKQSNNGAQSTAQTAVKKVLTKAPPLNFPKKNKHKSGLLSTRTPSVSSAESDLTAEEFHKLKCLYKTETGADNLPQINEACNQIPACGFINQGNTKDSEAAKVFTPKAISNQMFNGAEHVASTTQRRDLACSPLNTVLENGANYAEKRRPVPQALMKPWKKAPPLKFSKAPLKISTTCETSEAHVSTQDASINNKESRKDISKVMKLLGIKLDGEILAGDSIR